MIAIPVTMVTDGYDYNRDIRLWMFAPLGCIVWFMYGSKRPDKL